MVVGVLAASARAESPAPTSEAVARFEAPPADKEPALGAMKAYFRGEIYGGFTLIGMGVAGLSLGGALYATADGRDSFTYASYPLLGLGSLHLLAGVFVNVSSVRRIGKFGKTIDVDPEDWVRREEKRMRGVEKQFLVLKIVEGVGIAGGIGLAAYGRETDRPKLTGFALAFAGECLATLIFDVVAARRAKRYRTALGKITF